MIVLFVSKLSLSKFVQLIPTFLRQCLFCFGSAFLYPLRHLFLWNWQILLHYCDVHCNCVGGCSPDGWPGKSEENYRKCCKILCCYFEHKPLGWFRKCLRYVWHQGCRQSSGCPKLILTKEAFSKTPLNEWKLRKRLKHLKWL